MTNVPGIICIALLLAGGSKCCRVDKHLRVTDKLEAVVIVGFDKPPKCVQPPPPFTGRQAQVNNPIPVWVRAVRFDQIKKPLSGRKVELDVVDPFGRELPDSPVIIDPAEIETLESGFNARPITITCKVPYGEYIVRASYADKSTTSVSYSAHLFCRQN